MVTVGTTIFYTLLAVISSPNSWLITYTGIALAIRVVNFSSTITERRILCCIACFTSIASKSIFTVTGTVETIKCTTIQASKPTLRTIFAYTTNPVTITITTITIGVGCSLMSAGVTTIKAVGIFSPRVVTVTRIAS